MIGTASATGVSIIVWKRRGAMNQNSYVRILLTMAIISLPFTIRAEETIPPPAPQQLPRTSAEIKLDGNLDDPGWKDALVGSQLYVNSPGNNTPPKVKTTAYLAYDNQDLDIGIKADDPNPSKIRSPYVQ